MTSPVKFKIKGDRELMDKFHRLDRKIKRTVAAKALRAGAKVIVSALRSGIPHNASRAAYKAIGTKIKTYRDSGITVAITGERMQGKKNREKGKKSKYGAPHLHLIEYGTVERHWTGEKGLRKGGQYGLARALQVTQRKMSKGQSLSRSEQVLAASILGGRSTGKVTPRPFFQKAWQANIGKVHAAQVAVMRREIEALAKTG